MKAVILVIAAFTTITGYGQRQIKTHQYTTEDGLPQNSVNQIHQDGEGYIWIGTQDGLAKFNGYEFEVFRPDEEDSFSISDNFIIQFIEDRFGKFWIRTRDGLNILDKKSRRFHKIHNVSEPKFNQPGILRYHDDNIWLQFAGDTSNFYVIPDDLKLHFIETDIEAVSSRVPYESYPTLFFPIGENELIKLDKRTIYKISDSDSIKKEHEHKITGSRTDNWDFEIHNDNLILSQPSGLVLIDIDGLTVKNIPLPYQPLTIAWNGNKYYAGTASGIYTFNETFEERYRLSSFSESFDNIIIHHIYSDRQDRLWLGTANKGLYVHHPNQEEFQYMIPSSHNPAIANHVWDANYRDGSMLIGSNSGILECDLNQSTIDKTFLSNHRITSVLIDKEGNHWAGTAGKGLYVRRPGKNQYRKVFAEAGTISILKEIKGVIWIGSYSGLYKVVKSRGEFRFKKIENPLSGYVLSLYADKMENIWIGHNAGISVLSTSTGMIKDIPYEKGSPRSPNFNFITGFTKVNGVMYAATYGGGISRLNADSTFTNFTEKEGLSNNILHSMGNDLNGNIWVTSNGGLSRFDPDEESFKNFTTTNGLISHNFSISSMNQSKPGHLMIGTVDGLLTFKPDDIRTSYSSPQLKIEGIDINYLPSGLPANPGESPIVLRYTDKVFTLYFTALNYNDPGDVIYKHKLDGFDDKWVTNRPFQRNLVYSSLPHGEYTLILVAESKSNLFDPATLEIEIVVLPPVWLRPWFYLSFGIMLLCGIIGVVYYLSRRNLKARVMELETKEKVQLERERISRDLHDSVGTHFAYIISKLDYLYLGWNRKKIENKKDYLGKVSEFARSGMRLLRETIWALNQPEVEVDGLKAKIHDYLLLCFTNERPGFKFKMTSDATTVNSSVALHCFRIIQESVSNSLKYANAKQININFHIADTEHFELYLVDDGKGFSMNDKFDSDGHFGLKNIESRSQEMGAKIELESDETGTRISVIKD